MKSWVKRIAIKLIRLFLGYFILSYGFVMTINANLGLGTWDVFHQGISNMLGITIGQANILVGSAITLSNFFFKEKIGWGTVFNMIFIGLFIDILMMKGLVPIFQAFTLRLLMIVLGLYIIGFGTYLYIGVGLGSGPRDGLMIALVKKTGKSVRFIKNTQEIIVVVIGYILGGQVGIGTIIMSFLGGYIMQFVFKLAKFDINEVSHRFIDDDIRFLKEKLANSDQH